MDRIGGSISNQVSKLALSFRETERLPDLDLQATWRGCSIEHKRMSRSSDYAFAFAGQSHYVAYHDIVMEEGRMLVDSLAPIDAGDIRNTLTYVPPGCHTSGWSATRERTNSFTILYFDPAEMARETEGLFDRDDLAPMIYFQDRGLRTTMLRLQELLVSDEAPDPILAETLAMLAAVELARLRAGSTPPPDAPPVRPGDRGIMLARAYVEDNLARNISLDDMAGVAGLSRYHFLRVFKAATGETPHRYVQARRAERAMDMLRHTGLPLADIAQATGFKSAPRFVRAFRDVTGTTPGAWRRSQS